MHKRLYVDRLVQARLDLDIVSSIPFLLDNLLNKIRENEMLPDDCLIKHWPLKYFFYLLEVRTSLRTPRHFKQIIPLTT